MAVAIREFTLLRWNRTEKLEGNKKSNITFFGYCAIILEKGGIRHGTERQSETAT